MNPTVPSRVVDTAQSDCPFVGPQANIALVAWCCCKLSIPHLKHLQITILAIILLAQCAPSATTNLYHHGTTSSTSNVSWRQLHLYDQQSDNVNENLIDDMSPSALKHMGRNLPKTEDLVSTETLLFRSGNGTSPARSQMDIEAIRAATKHLKYVRDKFSCSEPRPKLVKALDVHPSHSKQYIPRCTVVYRCGDDTGCCEDVTHKCGPEKTEMIELYFHVVHVNKRNNITGGLGAGIQALTFLNHTKCACMPISNKPRAIDKRPPLGFAKQKQPRPNESHHHKCKDIIKCPEPFAKAFRQSDKRCICDCLSNYIGHHSHNVSQYNLCLKIKNGVEHLDEYGARCVRTKDCSEPACNMGLDYDENEARCLPKQSGYKWMAPGNHLGQPRRARHRRHHHNHRNHLARKDKCTRLQHYNWNWLAQ